MDPTPHHNRKIVDQFSLQSVYFEKLPGHEEATELLVRMARISSNDEVLDVACGAGPVACAAARTARRVAGIDLTPAMIERAAALQSRLGLQNLEWRVGDVARLPFESNRFDVVLTRYSLHHFLEPELVLAEMMRVCRPAGRMVVADLVLAADKVEAYDRMERVRDPSHVHVLTEVQLNRLFVGIGLIDLEWAGYSWDLDLETLLKASFPLAGDTTAIRAILEADIGVNNLGVGLRKDPDVVRLTYPILIGAGVKPRKVG